MIEQQIKRLEKEQLQIKLDEDDWRSWWENPVTKKLMKVLELRQANCHNSLEGKTVYDDETRGMLKAYKSISNFGDDYA